LKRENLVNANSLNQYLYCPRRLWYQKYYDTIGENYYLRDGEIKHKNKGRRGGWTREIYLESEKYGIHGKIDVLESNLNIPVERKRGKYYRENDIIQLTAYCLLVEENSGEKTRSGIIYLHGTDERHRIQITKSRIEKLKRIVKEIKNFRLEQPPKIVANKNKCQKCSARKYCMPKESRMLGETNEQLE